MSWFSPLQGDGENNTFPPHLRWLLWRSNEIMCLKTFHILCTAFFPFSQGIPSMPMALRPSNINWYSKICIFSCGLFPRSQSSIFICLWISPPGESSGIYNSICPVEMALFRNPHKHFCSHVPPPSLPFTLNLLLSLVHDPTTLSPCCTDPMP